MNKFVKEENNVLLNPVDWFNFYGSFVSIFENIRDKTIKSETEICLYNPKKPDSKDLSEPTFILKNGLVEVKKLNEFDIQSKVVQVIDNNDIDREVTKYRPTHVIIEALWVVPSKFAVLTKLHPNVKWIIRLHSEMPFMAGEGNAMDWLGDYSRFKNIIIGVNAPRMLRETRLYLQHLNKWTETKTNEKVVYLPNYYPQEYKNKPFNKDKYWVDVGCFGAIRPLKNHLLQAFGAIEFAEKIGKQLRFHVNAGRIEMQGGPALNNLKGLFQQINEHGHQMVNHQWRPREDFLELCSEMDIGLQVSFSETFNIVGADLVSQGVPLVGSVEIPWHVPYFGADPTSSKNICDKLLLAYRFPQINASLNQWELTRYTNKTSKIWHKYFT